MIKKHKSLIFFILVILNSHQLMANRYPPETSSTNKALRANVFKKIDEDFKLHFHLSNFHNETLNNQKSLGLNFRYKLNLKTQIALGSSFEYGNRHNADWDKPSPTIDWRWNQTQDRREHISYAFIQHKDLFNAKGDILYKLRLGYRINSFNNQQNLILKSGLIYLYDSNWSFLTQAELIIATNYQNNKINQIWLYNSAVYHLNSFTSLGLTMTIGAENWFTSKRFNDITNDEFKTTNEVRRIGLIFNFYFN